MPRPAALRALDREIVDCRACPRLVEWREQVARREAGVVPRRRRTGADRSPASATRAAGCSIAGLAPAAHGANRTGRVFTGDRSGDFLYASLYRTGFANQPTSVAADDGLELHDALRHRRGALRAAGQQADARGARSLPAVPAPRARPARRGPGRRRARRVRVRGHRPRARGRRRAAPDRRDPSSGTASRSRRRRAVVLGCYHPSQQNTFTGKLTEPMIDAVFLRARGAGRRGTLAPVTLADMEAGCSRASTSRSSRRSRPTVPSRSTRSNGCATTTSTPASAGIVALGTTGESPALDAAEQRAVIDACAAGLRRARRAAHRRRRHQQHRQDRRRGRGARGHPGARRDADRRAVLRPPVGGRRRRALPRRRRRQPGAGRRLQHPDPHRPQPRPGGDARAGAAHPTSWA